MVYLKRPNPGTNTMDMISVNSCLYPLLSCDGAEIETIEYLKNPSTGRPHDLSRRLAHYNGSQCGYCSPAMVMSTYSLMQRKNGNVTMDEVEKSLGGLTCRCTGYRPILDAFKSVASDAPPALTDNYCADIEDMPLCKTTGTPCASQCAPEIVKKCFPMATAEWRKPLTLAQIFEVLTTVGNRKYMLVGGNTAHGVYRRPRDIEVFIDVNNVAELKNHSVIANGVEIGGSVTLTDLIDILQSTARSNRPQYHYMEQLKAHVEMVAHLAVRNVSEDQCIY